MPESLEPLDSSGGNMTTKKKAKKPAGGKLPADHFSVWVRGAAAPPRAQQPRPSRRRPGPAHVRVCPPRRPGRGPRRRGGPRPLPGGVMNPDLEDLKSDHFHLRAALRTLIDAAECYAS